MTTPAKFTPVKSLDDLFSRLDACQGKWSKFQIPGNGKSTPEAVVSHVSGLLPNLSDVSRLKDPALCKALTDKFLSILPKGDLNMMKRKGLILTQIKALSELQVKSDKRGDLDAKIALLKQQKEQAEEDLKKVFILSDVCNQRLQTTKAIQADMISMAGVRNRREPIDPLDAQLFLKACSFQSKLFKNARANSPDGVKELNEINRLKAKIGALREKTNEDFLSRRHTELLLSLADTTMMDIFLKKYLMSVEPAMRGAFRNLQISNDSSQEDKDRILQQAFNKYLQERLKPLPQVVERVPAQVRTTEEKEAVDAAGVEEVQAVVDTVIEEFPYEYDPRVLMWLKNSPSAVDEEFLAQYQRENDSRHFNDQFCFHGFSEEVDQFYRCGIEAPWENKTTGKQDTLFLVPGEMSIGDTVLRGAFGYCISAVDGKCYHRYFQQMDMRAILDTFSRNVFHEQDFPDALAAKDVVFKEEQPVQQDETDKDVCSVSLDRSSATIVDKRLDITIKLTLL